MVSGDNLVKRKSRSPLFWGCVFFPVFFVFFLVVLLNSVPDISALERIADGEPDVPIKTLSGRELFVYHSPQYGEKIPLSLSEISDEMIALTITTEDSRFFNNLGFSPAAIVRAVLQNLHLRKTYSGASTITQQVVRNILFPEDVRFERSFTRKALEIFLSAGVTFCYDKETILSLYLNEIYYGRNATGVGKAAEIYFGKPASELDLLEAAFIAGLPQAPNYYGNNHTAGEIRQQEVLRIFERAIGREGCIPLESGREPRCFCPVR